MFKRITRVFAAMMIPMLMSPTTEAVGIMNKAEIKTVTYENMIDTIKVEELKTTTQSYEVEYLNGWTTTAVNVRKGPSTDSDILDTYTFNTKVKYVDFNKDWVEIKYGDSIAFMCKKYISVTECTYQEFSVPNNSGFKSYMDYRCITSTGSKQYKLQQSSAYTGTYGIRQIDGRYCVAVGSHFTTEIGEYFDLVLENGTVIPCVLGDAKADKDTDSSNIVTEHNGCLSEFIVDTGSLYSSARRMGDISYCNDDWNSPVEKIRVYN